jgi:GAF domain-containing protein
MRKRRSALHMRGRSVRGDAEGEEQTRKEREVLRALVEIADTFVADYDAVEFLHRLAVRCVALLDVDEAGVMLVDGTGGLRYVASSSEQMRLVELFELQQEEGPCLDAYQQGRVIVSARSAEVERSWPRFASRARDAGLESLAGVPMRLRDERIGALNLFSRRPGGLSDDDLHIAQAMADVATIGVLQARAIHDRQVVAGQLQTALESRIAIEQAKGFIAEHLKISVDDAFTLLRHHSRTHNEKLTGAARRVISGGLRPEMLSARARPPKR